MINSAASHRPAIDAVLSSLGTNLKEIRHGDIRPFERQPVMDAHASKFMASYCSKIRLRFAFAGCVPLIDIRSANLEVHLRGNAVTQIDLDSPVVKTVLFGVNEPRRNHETGGIDRLLACQGCLCNCDNSTILDANVAHVVKIGLRINHSTV